MFEVFTDIIIPITVAVMGGAALTILVYIGRSLNSLIKYIEMLNDKQEKTDRILYGEDDISEGLIKMVLDNRREVDKLRLLQLDIINKLRKENIIDYDADIKEICVQLNKDCLD